MRLEVTGRRHFGGKDNPAYATVFLDRVSENTLDKLLNRWFLTKCSFLGLHYRYLTCDSEVWFA